MIFAIFFLLKSSLSFLKISLEFLLLNLRNCALDLKSILVLEYQARHYKGYYFLQHLPYNPYHGFYESLYLTSKDSQTEYRWRMKNMYWSISDIYETYRDLLDGLEESIEPPPTLLGINGKTAASFTKGTTTKNPNTGFQK